MRRLSVFISSRIHELEYEREKAIEVITNLNAEPILFELFPSLSESPEQTYIQEVRNCDIFIIILWKTLGKGVLEEYKTAVDENKPILLFLKYLEQDEKMEKELELFLRIINGGKIDEKEFENIDKNIASLLREIYTRSAYKITTYKRYRKLSQFSEELKRAILNELAKMYESPVTTTIPKEMYKLGIDIINTSKNRLCILQRTPSLLFGARPYDSPYKIHYEEEFYNCLIRWIESCISNPQLEMFYVFSFEHTKRELQKIDRIVYPDGNIKDLNKIENKKEWLKELFTNILTKIKKSKYRFRVGFMHADKFSGPLAVGDNRFAIWIVGDSISISQLNNKLADEIFKIISRNINEIPENEGLEKFIQELLN